MINVYTYRIPFVSKLITSKGTFSHREGAIIAFKKDGVLSFGEVAPLPGFSNESLDECLSVLKGQTSSIEDGIVSENPSEYFSELYKKIKLPSVKFGIDTLRFDYLAKKNNQTLVQLLFPKSEPFKIPVNGTLGSLDKQKSLSKAHQLVKEGFQTIKIKVGLNSKNELRIIEDLRKEFPDLKIRIDANQAWGLSEAIDFLTEAEAFGIQYCEEPLKSAEQTHLKELSSRTSINLALDESIRNKEEAFEVQDKSVTNTVVIKPMLFGSFSDINVTINHLSSHDINTVFTTSLESIIGRTITAILTMGWGAKQLAHGLSTGSMLKSDLSIQKEIVNGFYKLNEQPGLGIKLNFNRLKKII